jgi:fructose transport system substrate-binding protein
VDNVSKGVIGATSMQFPLKMAQLGIDAIAAYAKNGTKPQATPGKDFYDTGVQLITDDPQAGVAAKDSTWGKQNCWG